MTLGADPLREKIRDLVDEGFEVSFKGYDDQRGLVVTLELPTAGNLGLRSSYALPGLLIDRDNRQFPITYLLTEMERKIRNELMKDNT